MPTLHRSPLDNRWVVLASQRGARPGLAGPSIPAAPAAVDACPFCPGHESMTLPAVHACGEPGAWVARVVGNKYPAFTMTRSVGDDPDALTAHGSHEVMIVSRDHSRRWSTLTDLESRSFASALSARIAAHDSAGHVYTQLIINDGHAAGASIDHIHAQLIAMPFVPPALNAEIPFLEGPKCALCDFADETGPSSPWRVGECDGWVVACPVWSATPFELLIFPRRHGSASDRLQHTTYEPFAEALRSTCAALDETLGPVSFNVVMHMGPATNLDFHRHAHVWPALSNITGFERGTGVYVNTMPSDAAAALLAPAFARA